MGFEVLEKFNLGSLKRSQSESKTNCDEDRKEKVIQILNKECINFKN